jgi:hypothetical protein
MDWQFKIGLGTALAFFFFPYAVKDMPGWITWPGVVVGCLFAAWGVLPGHEKIPLTPAFLFIGGVAAIVASISLYFGTTEPQIKANFPDVVMRLIYPERPAILLENISDATALQIKYAVALLHIDGSDVGKPVQIPISTFDFIKGREGGGPQNLFDPPNAIQSPNKGDRLFGWIQVSCPTCIATHYYWTYVHFGYDGWYSEVLKERHEAITKWLRENGPFKNTDEDVNRVLSVIAPVDRISIKPN